MGSMDKKYTFINGDERRENLNDVELAEVVMDIVMSNLHCSFQWNTDGTVIAAEG
jgi:hypothetical protein